MPDEPLRPRGSGEGWGPLPGDPGRAKDWRQVLLLVVAVVLIGAGTYAGLRWAPTMFHHRTSIGEKELRLADGFVRAIFVDTDCKAMNSYLDPDNPGGRPYPFCEGIIGKDGDLRFDLYLVRGERQIIIGCERDGSDNCVRYRLIGRDARTHFFVDGKIDVQFDERVGVTYVLAPFGPEILMDNCGQPCAALWAKRIPRSG